MVSYNSFSNPKHYEMLRYQEDQAIQMDEAVANISSINSRCEAILGNGNHSESYFENRPCHFCGVLPTVTTPGIFQDQELWVPLAYEDMCHGFMEMNQITPINGRIREDWMIGDDIIAVSLEEGEYGEIIGQAWTERALLKMMGVEIPDDIMEKGPGGESFLRTMDREVRRMPTDWQRRFAEEVNRRLDLMELEKE